MNKLDKINKFGRHAAFLVFQEFQELLFKIFSTVLDVRTAQLTSRRSLFRELIHFDQSK